MQWWVMLGEFGGCWEKCGEAWIGSERVNVRKVWLRMSKNG